MSFEVSVIVCAHNEARLIRDCLTSLFAQSHTNFEIVIIDDESTDATFNICKELIEQRADGCPKTSLYRISRGGLSAARNAGIRNSEAPIVVFIDGDAIAAPDWLTNLVAPFAASNKTGYTGGRIDLLNDDSWLARFSQVTRHRQCFRAGELRNEFVGCNMAFRRSALESVGGFAETFVARGDEVIVRERFDKSIEYAPAPNAVVRHERPATLKELLRVEWQAATLQRLMGRASGPDVDRRMILNEIYSILIAGFVPFTMLALISQHWVWQALACLGAIAFGHHLFLRRFGRQVLKGVVSEYGVLRGTALYAAHCLCQKSIFAAGYPWGRWTTRKTRIVPHLTSITRITDRCVSG